MMGRVYCHYCTRFLYMPLAGVGFGCPICRRSFEAFEPHHVLRGRCCPGNCGADLVVTFEPVTSTPGEPLCPVCFTAWRTRTIERDGVVYEPVVRRDYA